MDKDRQIRFLYPPLILICSIALGCYFDNSIILKDEISKFFHDETNAKIVVAIFAGSSTILVLGFLLSTITIFFLRLFFRKNDFNYEIKLSEDVYQKIGGQILRKGESLITKKDKHFAGIVFDHGFIQRNIHQWMVRRWNAFIISSSSILALLTSLILGLFLNISLSLYWLLCSLPLIAIFTINARYSWKDSMDMLEFMSKIRPEKEEVSTDSNVSSADSNESSSNESED